EAGLRAVICDVSSSSGERRNFPGAHGDARAIAPGDAITARKVLHVSPFCRVEGDYAFRFGGRGQRTWTRIDYRDAAGPLIATALHGHGAPLRDAGLLHAFATSPLMTLG